ncbi:uncharacterized protein LOC115453065 isoform X2 [Manduca sexta]|nr:uncharacterized protein LOC115453065 isoform X2 [Manduca sexta]
MPAADELASQRERELLCEQELRALSASHVARCDSSGSEGEAALAAAVQALSVLAAPTPPAATPDALSTRSVLSALLPHLPPAAFLNKYLHATDYLDDATLTALTDDKEEVSWSSCQEVAELVSARSGALQPDARYAVVQLVGRRLAAAPRAPGAARARLLRELERAPAPAHRYHTEHLKVSVGVSKLQSLFGRLQNNGHGQETKTTNKL